MYNKARIMNSEPFVSVVLPTYNGSAYVARAIESVVRQTYRNFELVVVDDGSTDGTKEILRQFGRRYPKLVVVTHETNKGFVQTLNDGVAHARGAYIARIDDDDEWCDERKLEKQVIFLREHSEYGLVGGGIIRVDQQGRELGRYIFPERDEDIRNVILADNAFAHSAVMFRKDFWEQTGGYRPEFHFFADWALWLAIGKISKFYNFPEYFALYLEKEQSGNYDGRDKHIRRKIGANLLLAWRYRKQYPGFLRACFLSWARYGYSHIPFRFRTGSVLYNFRILLFGSPGHTLSHLEQEKKSHTPICIVGAGYVGLVTGACLAELGNEVICVDRDEGKIERLRNGVMPFYEPGLEPLVQRNVSEGRMRFTTDMEEGVRACDTIFICVGTPRLPSGKADLSGVEDVARKIGMYASSDKIVVEKSTVPVHTFARIRKLLEENNQDKNIHFSVVCNPEFLREGSAIYDFFHPDRIVVGFEAGESQKDAVLALYKTIDAPKISTDIASAELTKEASNAFLAFKISFINLISRLCEATGADVKEVAWGMGLDKRIGFSFLEAGIGYGGSCFPKDVRALENTLEEKGIRSALLRSIEEINEGQKELFVERIKTALGGIRGKSVAVLGLSFKPNTDDMRDAPSVSIIAKLQQEGVARIKAYDPRAMENAKVSFREGVEFCENPYEAAKDADALVILTEWNEFKDMDLERIRSLLKQPLIIDGRNMFDPQRMAESGFTYICIGRRKEDNADIVHE